MSTEIAIWMLTWWAKLEGMDNWRWPKLALTTMQQFPKWFAWYKNVTGLSEKYGSTRENLRTKCQKEKPPSRLSG